MEMPFNYHRSAENSGRENCTFLMMSRMASNLPDSSPTYNSSCWIADAAVFLWYQQLLLCNYNNNSYY